MGRVTIEIRVGNDRIMMDECERSHLQFLNETQLNKVLQNRLGKSEPEIRQLLESHQTSTSSL
jgi:hypothetical protein